MLGIDQTNAATPYHRHLNFLAGLMSLARAKFLLVEKFLVLQYQDTDSSGREFSNVWSKQRMRKKGNSSGFSSQDK